MSEKETVFSSKISYRGVFSFADFYSFCHAFLTEDLGFGVSEGKYSEKISGEIGRAHVWTPVTLIYLVCRLLLEKKKKKKKK